MQFVTEKVQKWVSSVHNLSEIVVSWPQAAYADMTKYFQFAPLDHTMLVQFLPALFGIKIFSWNSKCFLFLSTGVVWVNNATL